MAGKIVSVTGFDPAGFMDSQYSTDLATVLLPLCMDANEGTRVMVRGWSMGSLMGPVSEIRVEKSRSLPRTGTVVLVTKGNGFVVHRIIRRDGASGQVVTKGDACRWPDPPVSLSDLAGEVTGIYRGEKLMRPLRMCNPWSTVLAWNSRVQTLSFLRFLNTQGRWNIFHIVYRIVERMERWKLSKGVQRS